MKQPEHWQQIDTLFQRALDVPARDRAAFVGDEASDDEVRSEVEALLAAHVQARGFIESPAFATPAATDDVAALRLPEDGCIGPYRVLRVLGAGGMGVVYEAEQDQPRRIVAIKIVRPGPWLTDRHIALFQREIRSLARLTHPGIACIHDAGTSADGLHYFAMERVDGDHLDDYLRRERPSRDERLALFVKIADAVSYAHQRGIIHRDLKPSNILVEPAPRAGGEPQPKVLDFGLARIVDVDDMTATDADRIMGSLPYMSPEQVSGAGPDVDVRSDVYTLGVVLYRLLTGRMPYDLDDRPPPETMRIITEQAPLPPERTDRALRGDLSTIVLKTLEKDPERRYASAAALADDIRRFRSGLPIAARPASAMYQIRSLIRRHRMVSALALVLVVTLLTFTFVTAFQIDRVRTERDAARHQTERAEREMIKAREVRGFLERMLASAKPENAQGEDVTVRAALDQASLLIEDEFEDQPEIEAALRFTIGSTYLQYAVYEPAERHLSRALELRRNVHAEPHVELVESLNQLGLLHRQRSENDAATALYEEALAVARTTPDISDELMLNLINNLGMLRHSLGDLDEAESLLTEGLARREAAFGPDDIKVAMGLNNLGLVYNSRHDYQRSKPLFERSLVILQAELPDEHPWLTSAIYNFAALLHRLDDIDGAEAHYRRVLELDRKVLGPDHPSVASTLNAIASVLESGRRYDEAEPLYHEALEIRRSKFGESHRAVAESLNNIALLLHHRGWYGPSLVWSRQGVAVLRALYDEPHAGLALALGNMGTTLRAMGRPAEAEAVLRESVAIYAETRAADHPARLKAEMMLAVTLLDRGDIESAEALARGVLAGFAGRLGDDHAQTTSARCNLAAVLQRSGAFDEAEALLTTALATRRATLDDNHPHIANTLHRLAHLHLDAGDAAAAEPLLREALAVTSLPAAHPDRERAQVLLARVLFAGDRDAEALESLRAALATDARRRAMVANAYGPLEESTPLLPPTRRAIEEALGRHAGDAVTAELEACLERDADS